ncbi:LADA_0G11826g1_1 [Lachancea dasiensis]|uniref:LADA_0G11826g1_1 n=1 Tax=Lachancea dasiensis TaxID=1072105 RepID=A0A1G4JV32_9SACH|nr:LADA_0G11826g1_1 [Lachancea dasiensis]
MNVVAYLTNRSSPPKHNDKGAALHNTNGSTGDQAVIVIRSNSEGSAEQSKTNTDVKRQQPVSKVKQVVRMIWMALIFVPYMLLVKPTLFIWSVLTFPLSFVESSGKEKIKDEAAQDTSENASTNSLGFSSSISPINTITEEDDDLGGDEMILQPDTVKGSLAAKVSAADDTTTVQQQQPQHLHQGSRQEQDHERILTPEGLLEKQAKNLAKPASVRSATSSAGTTLGSRRMGRFLFPKKLIPQSMLNRAKRRTLVLDLDETLIHSMSRGTSSSNSSQGHMVEVKFAVSGISSLYYVYKRPYCDLFLTKIANWYDLVIFTASMKEYADPVIDWLEGSFPGRFSRRLYRQDCTLRDGIGYIKDLSLLSSTHAPLSDIFIIDNSPVSYAMHVDNAIQVEGWISDPTDTDLLNLLPFLEALQFTTDVRNVLALKNGESAFAM